MIAKIIMQTAAAVLGTVSFALLYDVPKRFFPSCGLVGGTGWLLYTVFVINHWCTATVAAFIAALGVVFLSRLISVRQRCPATVFITTGIFPLVPGVGVYWTAYYMVTNQLPEALQSGFMAGKTAVAIVLGIMVIFEVPNRCFSRSVFSDPEESFPL